MLDPVRQTTPEPQKSTSTAKAPESPSQIPDSQPNPILHSILDASPHTPSPSFKRHITTPSSPHTSPRNPLPRIYQPTIRPPRAVSLEPVSVSPPNSPAPTDCFISPDRLPSKFPLFTSTPKSKSLKSLLPESVSLPNHLFS